MHLICSCLCPDNRAEGPRTHHSSYYRTFLPISHTVSYSKLYYTSSCIFRCISGRLTTAESGQSSDAWWSFFYSPLSSSEVGYFAQKPLPCNFHLLTGTRGVRVFLSGKDFRKKKYILPSSL